MAIKKPIVNYNGKLKELQVTDVIPYSDIISTGYLSGGAITINVDPTKFDIAPGVGVIIDNHSSPGIPIATPITWAGLTAQTPTYLATHGTTYISVDSSGLLYQTPHELSPSERRDYIQIGWVDHPDNINILFVWMEPVYISEVQSQMNDGFVSLGSFNISGNDYGVDSLLQIKKSAGSVFDNNANFQTDSKNPHVIDTPLDNPCAINYFYQDGIGGWVNNLSAVTNINPNQWDDGSGTLQSVPTEKWTIQVISLYPVTGYSGNDIQYGQKLYNSIGEARIGIWDDIILNPYNEPDLYRTFLLVRQGCTDLSNAAYADFIHGGKWGLFSIGDLGKSSIRPSLNIPVADTDYTITGVEDQYISYTSITTRRIVTLPPATVLGQKITILDPSGNVDETKRIRVICNGVDTLEGDIYNIQMFPYTSTSYTSNGTGKWIIGERPGRLSAGNLISPTLTDLGTGSITIGNNGLYNLYKDSNGLGVIRTFEITGFTNTALTDGVTNYVVADYNSGTPIIHIITNVSLINETTVIPLYTIYRQGTTLHTIDWDQLGLGLVNKIHNSIINTQRYRLESGLALGEVATRTITVTAGEVWIGANKLTLGAFSSATDTCRFAYHVAGVWTFSTITQYNNTQYDNGTALVALNPNKYAVNFVYRGVEVGSSEAIVVLGGGNYTLLEAQGSLPPANLPGLITSHNVLVGRIIVEQGTSSAYQIDSIFSTAFALSTSGVHNDLSGLQGGTTSEYYHTTAAQNIVIGNTSGTNTGDNAVNSLYSGLVTNATHTGDATGATALTVVKIQGKAFPTLGVGDDGKYPMYDNGTNAFIMSSIAGSGDMILASAQTNSGVKTFLDTTMKLRNVANTFDGYFVNTNTANRVYTLQNSNGTLAFTSDIPSTPTLQAVCNVSYTTTTALAADYLVVNTPSNGLIFTPNAGSDYVTISSASVVGNHTQALQNVSGTIALTSDITGTNSNTNTGDQSLVSTSDATSHTATLTKVSGTPSGSIKLVEGTNITLTTTGTGSDGIITIAATGGSGDMILASAQTVTGAKTFNDTKFLLRNVADTFSASFTNTNTADRIYTLPNRSITFDNINTSTTTNGTGFLKGNGSVISFDNSTYLTSLTGAVLTDQTVGQTIGLTGSRLTKLWATDITLTNALVGSVTGNAGSVTNATLTTALTVNTGTVTLTGNVANTSVLTIGAGAVSVSGSNTGDNTVCTSGAATTAQTLLTARTIAGTSFNGSSDITLSNKFILQGTSDTGLTGAQFLGALGTGIVKNTTTTGVLSIAINSDLPVMSATVGGAVPTPPNNTTTFLRGDGTFATPTAVATIITQDEGIQLSTTVTTLNFTGAGVTASGAGATTTIDIPSGPSIGLSYAISTGMFMN